MLNRHQAVSTGRHLLTVVCRAYSYLMSRWGGSLNRKFHCRSASGFLPHISFAFLISTFLVSPDAYAAQYVYDEFGRLVEVVASDGSSAQYRYDPAGNIVSIKRNSVGGLSLAEFSPDSGPAGTTVTIYGSGFSTTTASNTVKFNGTTAAVTAATAHQLTVKVPTGATTGPISVAVGTNTISSHLPFSVAAASGAAPTVLGFSPDNGPAGTAVTITGANFDPDKANNLVRINGDAVVVSAATQSQLQVTIPTFATSGKFTVVTSAGSATSTADFFIPPTTIPAADITKRGRLTVGGATVAVMDLGPAKYAQYLFDASAGQHLGLGVAALTFAPANGSGSLSISVKRPDGGDLFPHPCAVNYSAPTSAGSCNFSNLPQTGTYQLMIRADGSHTASFSLTLSSDLVASLTANATTPTNFSSSRPGQNGRYTFSGTAGKNYSIALSNVTVAGTWSYINVLAPNGAQIASGMAAAGYTPPVIDIANVPLTGTYTVFVDPYLANTGQIQLALRSEASGTLSIDGANTAVTLLDGQNGRYTFAGTIGQNLGLGISGLVTLPGGGTVTATIFGPAGNVLATCSSASNFGCSLPTLPATGTYSVVINPAGSNSAQLSLTLSKDITGTLTANATSPLTFSSTRPGQNGRYTFAGVAGKSYSLSLSNVTISGTWTSVAVFAPNGNQVGSALIGAGHTPPTIDVANASQTGTYTVVVDPYQASTGQVQLALREDVGGTLTVDGPPASLTLLEGQNARLTFEGMAGESLGLGVAGVTTTPSGGAINIIITGPTGTTLVTCNSIATANCNLPTLPVSGIYTVYVNPAALYASSLAISLSSDLTETVNVDSPTMATFSTTRPGQNGRYTFNGLAGRHYSVAIANTTIEGYWTYVYVFGPNKGQLATGLTSAVSSPSAIDLNAAPASGQYTVFIDPNMSNTGQVQFAVREDASGVLAVDGPPTAVSMRSGQRGRFTFTGTVGQNIGLGVTGFNSVPTGGSVSITVIGPTGANVTSCTSLNANASCNIPSLPANGTYTVLLNASDAHALALDLMLSSDITGTLAVDAATPSTFSTSRPGQNGRYTFSATAGKNYDIELSGVTISGTWTYVYVFGPDGTQLTSHNTAAGYAPPLIRLINAPASGIYTVQIDPYGANTGSMGLRVLDMGITTPAPQTTHGTIDIDGPSVTVNLPANQTYLYTFAGSAGQRLGLGVSGLATTPGANSIRAIVKRPDNTTLLIDCGSSASGFSCNLPPLPMSGTYTIALTPNGGASAVATLTLSEDVQGSLAINPATPAVISTNRAGQNGYYVFEATAGQNLSLAWSESTFTNSSALSVFRPDGTSLAVITFGSFGANGSSDLGTLPATGTYAVVIDPYLVSTGQVKLALRETLSGALNIDGASTRVSLAAGQNARLAFTGTTGQNLGVGFTGLSTSPAGGAVSARIYDPNGSQIADCSSGTLEWACNVGELQQSGTYSVVIDPSSSYGAALDVTLSSDIAGALTLNAPAPLSFSTTRPGQNGRFTFSGTAGQSLSVVLNQANIPGYWSYANVYKPDGGLLASQYFGISLADTTIDIGALPAAGTYTVFIDPYQANVGQVKLTLRETVAGTLAINGAATAGSLAPGQNARFTFNGTTGQSLGLGITDATFSPVGGAISVRVYDPSGALVTDCGTGSGAAWSCNLAKLQQAGQYAVLVDPSGTFGVTLNLTLSTDIGGAVTVNATAPTIATITRAGQNGRYTFNGTVGQRYSVAWNEATLVGLWSYLNVYRPDGVSMVNQYFGASNPSGSIDLGVLPSTGIYTLVVDPATVSTGQVKLNVNSALTGTLTVDGPAASVNLVTGRIAEYSFSGTSGTNLGAVLSAVATSPAPPSSDPLSLELRSPTGALLRSCTLGSSVNSSCKFPTLSTTGTHKLVIKPGPNAASFAIQLKSTI